MVPGLDSLDSKVQLPLQDRYVLDCKFCTEGKVIITRDMIEEAP